MESPLQRNIRTAQRVMGCLDAFDQEVEAAGRAIFDAFSTGHKLLAFGNGGSSADAAHLTTEFVCRFAADRRPYPAICLSSHGGDLTAIGNDYDFSLVFARQIQAFAQPGDVVVALSSSGQSENVVLGLSTAREQRATTIALLGKGGGRARGIAQVEIVVPSDDTARVQEAHQLLLHTVCEIAEALLRSAVQRMVPP